MTCKALGSVLAAALLLGHTCRCFAQNTIRIPGDRSTIQAGIDAAQNGDTVLVAPGTYMESIDFKGKAITVTSGATSFSDANSTILEGSGNTAVVTFATMEPPQAILNGFTVRNGGNADPNSCGGIAISNASPTVTNNIVTANQNCGISVDNYASPSILANDIIGNIGRGVIVYTGEMSSSRTMSSRRM